MLKRQLENTLTTTIVMHILKKKILDKFHRIHLSKHNVHGYTKIDRMSYYLLVVLSILWQAAH